MAYGSFGDIGMVPGYDSVRSDEGSTALGSQPANESARDGRLASQALQTEAYLRAQKYQADAAKKAAAAANSPGRLIAGVFGQALGGLTGGFGSALGKAAGASWLG
jgi:hypothetical protein